MPAASNSLMRRMRSSSPLGSLKAGHESPEAIRTLRPPTLGENKEIIMRDYLGYSADRIASLESAACSIAVSGKVTI